ncbi:antibiotic biosynthesis monooxygenase [Frankia sp. R82]|uniref:antibiotic biosynthesis monooxygenase family protein n=1 Tax=Frankia sp. R82 TaxID=2950553 RepID=UPI0020448A40|nr:antibiotic biosynthesis monooxygenase [Frankia sp. R82]MCM3882366.1 antibiotic biosynthesis monooxygenase [Frankia sp. R82]
MTTTAASTATPASTTTTTMINPIRVIGDPVRFQQIINLISEYMSTQPGFVQLRFYQSHKHTDRYYMIAEWADLETHQQAADRRSPQVLGWFAELKDLTEVAPDFFATLARRDATEGAAGQAAAASVSS